MRTDFLVLCLLATVVAIAAGAAFKVGISKQFLGQCSQLIM